MIRSFLFSPGDDEKKIGKASGIGADSVILDLEDSVAESRKPIARDLVSEFLLSEKNLASNTMSALIRWILPFVKMT